eukprot:9341571-Alexandrium_andersonii.AAC.1
MLGSASAGRRPRPFVGWSSSNGRLSAWRSRRPSSAATTSFQVLRARWAQTPRSCRRTCCSWWTRPTTPTQRPSKRSWALPGGPRCATSSAQTIPTRPA